MFDPSKYDHVSMLSGGIASWAAAKLVQEEINSLRQRTEVKFIRHRLVFTDTCMEDEDLYRFLPQAAANIMGYHDPLPKLAPILNRLPPLDQLEDRPPVLRQLAARTMELVPELCWLIDGRNPWDIFHDVKMLGNSRLDPCSRMLKREPAERWLSRQCNPRWTVVYVGIAWNERHRFEGRGNSKGIRARRAEDGWEYDAPLLWPPRMEREELVDWLKVEGIALPRLYHMGFSHNNCGGFCVRAGHDHYRRLLDKLPERFHYHEHREEGFQEFVGDSNTILRDRTGGESHRLPLSVLRQRVEAGRQQHCGDSQGCGCFIGDPED